MPKCERLCSRDYLFSLTSPDAIIVDVANGETPNGYMEDGRTPLIWAVLDPDPHEAFTYGRAFLSAGADVNTRDKEHGRTPLHFHFNSNLAVPDENLVMELLGRGADLLIKDNYGLTAVDMVHGPNATRRLEPWLLREMLDEQRRQASHLEGLKAMEKKRLPAAANIFDALAREGYAKSQYTLGFLLETSDDFLVPKDPGAAKELYSAAANQDYVPAIYRIASGYYFGRLYDQDYDAAFEWFTRGARLNHKEAQAHLALMYADGDGVDKDIYTSMMWLNLSQGSGLEWAEELHANIFSKLEPADLEMIAQMTRDCILDYLDSCETIAGNYVSESVEEVQETSETSTVSEVGWPPAPVSREGEPKVFKIDSSNRLCEVHWDGYKENDVVIDISNDPPEYWTESILITGSGNAIFVQTDPLQIYDESMSFEYVDEDGLEVYASILTESGYNKDYVIELMEYRQETDDRSVYRGRVFCP